MSYGVKEIFLSVQGEGVYAGRTSVFIRFAGCNLWSGLERDRVKAQCKFCDTDFVGTDGKGGGQFATAHDLAQAANRFWPKQAAGVKNIDKWVICTGGEPLLQLDTALIAALHAHGFKIAVESNGTIKAPKGIDWLCISPKADVPLVQTFGDELKLVYPQKENRPEDFEHLQFGAFSLQPLDDDNKAEHTWAVFEYCTVHPNWRVSLQLHKYLGVR